MKGKYFIFDLDDTLMYEIEYLRSAYVEIATMIAPSDPEIIFEKMIKLYKDKSDVFEYISKYYRNYTKEGLLHIYRQHQPTIKPSDGAVDLLRKIKESGHKIGLITDGRSITQRNKIRALNIEHFMDKIIISEEFGSSKPNEQNYKAFIEEGIDEYYYIADNISKDFIVPNKLGWTSICLLDNGQNIHKQDFDKPKEYLPNHKIVSLNTVMEIGKI